MNVSGKAHFEIFLNDKRFVAPHWHDSLEIISLSEGELLVSVDGRQYHLRGGDCIVLPPYSVHSALSTSGNSALLLQIPIGAFYDCLGSLAQARVLCDPFTSDRAQQECLTKVKNNLVRIMELQAELRAGTKPGAGLKCAGVVLDILYDVYTELAVSEERGGNVLTSHKNRERLSAVMAYTEAHYNEPITLEEAAERVHLQVNYFCHIFKESTGMTYLQYLNEYRLGRIYQDLIETEVPLKSLLERHGFTNYKLFRRMFADHFGTTPGKLRKGVSGGRIR